MSASGIPTDINPDQVKSDHPGKLLMKYYLFRDFLSSYNKLSELCFVDCVWDFTTRSVKSQEERCALNCMEKYLKMNQRISRRFEEFQIAANESALAEANKSKSTPR